MKFALALLCMVASTLAAADVTTLEPTGEPATDGPRPACGFSPINHEDAKYIVGGSDATEGGWPWQISLRIRGVNHACGGSIINERWVISASHCVDSSLRASNWKVRVGAHKFSGDGQNKDVEKLIQHPNWRKTGNFGGDLLLIKLKEPLDFSTDRVGPVCLPKADEVFEPTESAWISGWGYTNAARRRFPSKLQELNRKIITRAQCNKCSGGWCGRVQDHQVCFTDGSGGQSACMGDSGGPLVVNQNGTWVLAGATSWGSSRCSSYPNVYAKITWYLDWIEKTIAENSD